jgi:hypothetical protein
MKKVTVNKQVIDFKPRKEEVAEYMFCLESIIELVADSSKMSADDKFAFMVRTSNVLADTLKEVLDNVSDSRGV